MVFGVTLTGFSKKTYTDIRDAIITAIRAVPGLSRVNLARDSYMGGAVVAVANVVSEVWDVAAGVYASFDPDSAQGRALDNLAAIVGVYRKAATPTLVTATCTLTAGTYPIGVLTASPLGRPDLLFTNRDEVVSGGGAVAGIVFVCAQTGPNAVPTSTLTVISTPYPGWSAVTNPSDGAPGTNVESDAELRQRRLEGPPKGALANLDGIEKVFIFENNTDAIVGILPPHSFEAVVYDGSIGGTNVTDQAIGDALFLDKPAGIATEGSITVNVVDAVGLPHVVKFSRPTLVNIWLIVELYVDSQWDVVNGPGLVKQALVDFGNARYQVGVNVVQNSLFGPVYTVPGVDPELGVSTIKLGTAPAPGGTANIIIAPRELASLDTSRISVVVLP
jgi:hypothetical protein